MTYRSAAQDLEDLRKLVELYYEWRNLDISKSDIELFKSWGIDWSTRVLAVLENHSFHEYFAFDVGERPQVLAQIIQQIASRNNVTAKDIFNKGSSH